MTRITGAFCVRSVVMSSRVTIKPQMRSSGHAVGCASGNVKEARYETTAILD